LQNCMDAPELLEQRCYLGMASDVHYFSRTVEKTTLADENWVDLRLYALQLPVLDAGLAAYARGLQFWHARHGFCGICGHATQSEHAGHRRRCMNHSCGAEHFPRTDPAIIVAVEHDGDLLLGRQASWPEGRYSTLAGFVEPGESLEDALAREVQEEAGVSILSSHYFSSQPWPFPASLMLGFTAIAASKDLRVGAELSDARWFSVQDFESAICSGALKVPPPVSVSFRLIENWYDHHPQNLTELTLVEFIARNKKP
jgi:NAD+ diphosphatase